ncbi:NUDIX hydrolase [candidate division KSB1 bacterium]|nr:NUDIX hydrolase [candidate division KSB1 bacterium]
MTTQLDKFKQSGVVPVRRRKKKLQVLVITTRRGKKWGVPKGIIEADLTPQQSAAKEAFEEAGIRGVVHNDAIGEYMYEKWGGTCHVKLYMMQVNEEVKKWPEAFRKRKWVSFDKATKLVENDSLKILLQNLGVQLANDGQLLS